MADANNLVLAIMIAVFGGFGLAALLYYGGKGIWGYIGRSDEARAEDEKEVQDAADDGLGADLGAWLTEDEIAEYGDHLALIAERANGARLRWLGVVDAGSRGSGLLAIGPRDIWFARRLGEDAALGWRDGRAAVTARMEGDEALIGKEGRPRPAIRFRLTGEKAELCAGAFMDALADDEA